jgi:putative oxidoreductase
MAKTAALLLARLIFAGAFLMAAGFKFMDMGGTADYIAAVHGPGEKLALGWRFPWRGFSR